MQREFRVDKHDLSERDICTKFITPAIQQAGWLQQQFELSGSQLRQLIVMEPRLIAFGTGPLQVQYRSPRCSEIDLFE